MLSGQTLVSLCTDHVATWNIRNARFHPRLTSLQGVPATLCASIILINPIAKLALTMEPVAAAATSALKGRTQGLSDPCRVYGEGFTDLSLAASNQCRTCGAQMNKGGLWWGGSNPLAGQGGVCKQGETS